MTVAVRFLRLKLQRMASSLYHLVSYFSSPLKMTEFALIVLLLYDMLATAFTFAFCSHVYASAGCCTKDKDGKAEMSKRAAALVACLDLCTTQCRTSLPQRDTVLELWALSNSFTLEWADDPRTAIAEDACEVRPCEAIINSLARMLLALIFIIDLPALVEGSSSDSNNKPAGLREAHNQAAAATRAARVRSRGGLLSEARFRWTSCSLWLALCKWWTLSLCSLRDTV